MKNEHCAIILSHKRADNVKTYTTLKKQGYTGAIYILIDDEDPTAEEYKKRYGEEVYVFSKSSYDDKFDICDNLEGRLAAVYARNACFDLAEKKGYRFFMELDDDYSQFYWATDPNGGYHVGGTKNKDSETYSLIKNLDKVFDTMKTLMINTPTSSIAMAQGGDFVGGANGPWKRKVLRKCMNTWLCDTTRRFDFMGRMNDDVNTYLTHGNKGKLFFTTMFIRMVQTETQKDAGGSTEIYRDLGTYNKTFYSVMHMPSSVKISTIGKHRRLHHNVAWNNTVPKILREEHKK